MFDNHLLLSGLSTLNLHESRHAMRYVLSTLGGGAANRYDDTVAKAALARLTPDQRAALTAYCRSFVQADVKAVRREPAVL